MKIPKLPVYWTAEEAHTVYELLQVLQEEIWRVYGQDIQQHFAHLRHTEAPRKPQARPEGAEDDF